MDPYDALLLALFAGALGCFWRARRRGELRDATVTVRRCVEQGVHWAR